MWSLFFCFVFKKNNSPVHRRTFLNESLEIQFFKFIMIGLILRIIQETLMASANFSHLAEMPKKKKKKLKTKYFSRWRSKISSQNLDTNRFNFRGQGELSHVWLSAIPRTDYPWNSPGQNTAVGSLCLLQGIFPNPGIEPKSLYCRWILYQLSPQGSPRGSQELQNKEVIFRLSLLGLLAVIH